MALALRLRQALAAASTSASLLRPGSTAASRSLPLGPLVPPLPRPHLPGAAAGFRSTAAARGGDYGGGVDDGKISLDEILFEGCDYNHWLITMEFPDPKPSRDDMIEIYLQTLAKVVGRSFRKYALAAAAASKAKFIKVVVDGTPYLRKVDLEAYAGYNQLLAALQDKFFAHFTVRKVGDDEIELVDAVSGTEYVPTYEDKDGDWMLVGDVPWKMFVETCQRLRLMKSSEAVNLAPRAAHPC